MANVKDLASGIVATAPSPATSGLSLTLQTGQGATMPIPPFYGTGTPQGSLSNPGTSEIVLVTAVVGDVLTIVRAQKGTTAKSIAVGWIFSNGIYADDVLSSSMSFDGVFNQTPNSALTTFTTPLPFTSIIIFKGTTFLIKGIDYTTPTNSSVTFTSAPATGSNLRYVSIIGSQVMSTGSNGPIFDETPSGLVNGINGTYTTARPYTPGTLSFYSNGDKQKRGVHFFETSPATGTFTVVDAPIGGSVPDDVMVDYWYQISTTGNADTVDGFNASATPTANTIPVFDANGNLPGVSWLSWTPTFTNLSGGTLNQGKYTQIGKTVYYRFKYTTSGANVAGAVSFSLPVPNNTDYAADLDHDIGVANYIKSGTQLYKGWASVSTANTGRLWVLGVTASLVVGTQGLSTSSPFTWANNDYMIVSGYYEAA